MIVEDAIQVGRAVECPSLPNGGHGIANVAIDNQLVGGIGQRQHIQPVGGEAIVASAGETYLLNASDFVIRNCTQVEIDVEAVEAQDALVSHL